MEGAKSAKPASPQADTPGPEPERSPNLNPNPNFSHPGTIPRFVYLMPHLQSGLLLRYKIGKGRCHPFIGQFQGLGFFLWKGSQKFSCSATCSDADRCLNGEEGGGNRVCSFGSLQTNLKKSTRPKKTHAQMSPVLRSRWHRQSERISSRTIDCPLTRPSTCQLRMLAARKGVPTKVQHSSNEGHLLG